jgi:uncharacterized repeat protein (TIGR03803 family)
MAKTRRRMPKAEHAICLIGRYRTGRVDSRRDMKKLIKRLCLIGWLAFPANPAAAQVIDILYSFKGGATDGRYPQGSLVLSGSNLYGMTQEGGPSELGTIFGIGIDGTGYQVLHSFSFSQSDGQSPYGSLVASGNTLYGMTLGGGSNGNNGTIFQIGTNGSGFGLIRSFSGGPNDGEAPLGSLALSGTTFYGMTSEGGGFRNNTGGIAFSINPAGTGFSVLHSFGGPSDGQGPYFGAPAVTGAVIYGTTVVGGIGGGVVFKMDTDGTGYDILHTFGGSVGGDGAAPDGQVIVSSSTIYGMTSAGGTANHGTIYRMNTDGTGYEILHDFTGATNDAFGPTGELTLVGSTLYGVVGNGGADALGIIFGINTDGSDFQVLHTFAGGQNDGAGPAGDLLVVGSTFYGMTSSGGANNDGTVFSFTVVPEPSSLVLLAAGGALAILAHRCPAW